MLYPRDLHRVLNVVGRAAAKWRPIGTALQFDFHVLDIIATKPDNIARGAEACFSDLLSRWLNWAPPCKAWPTLDSLVAALRSETVEEYRLALELEQTFKVTLETASGEQVSEPIRLPVLTVRVEEVRAKISQFEDRFKILKRSTRAGFECRKISVKMVVECLTDLSADDMPEHKIFLETHIHVLSQADGHLELFGSLNFYWNYLAYHLLEHVIKEFNVNEAKHEMAKYGKDLQEFRRLTPLKIFCRAQKQRRVKPPPEFVAMVAEHNWPENVTLETVENFRQEFAWHYSLRDFAMMLTTVTEGSFIVTWFIPESIVGHLTFKMVGMVLTKHSVTKLEIGKNCIYDRDKASQMPTSAEPVKEYWFIEELPSDYKCPVMLEVLLEPHQTACCGQHLSQDATVRIKKEKGECPLCKDPNFQTTEDKYFRRKVYELGVFCSNKRRGCEWEGELGDLDHHVDMCIKYTSVESDKSQPECSQRQRGRKITVKAPRSMRRGDAVAVDTVAYFMPHDSCIIYKYDFTEDQWTELPACPHSNSALVIVGGVLTAVGGEDGMGCSAALYSYVKGKWVRKFSAMRTARSHLAAIEHTDLTTSSFVLAIGGWDGEYWIPIVEQLFVTSNEWITLTNLPRPIRKITATLHDGDVFVSAPDGTLYKRAIRSFLLPDQSWKLFVYPVPLWDSTITSFCNELLAIGGATVSMEAMCDIYQFYDGRWLSIGRLRKARWDCLVAVLSGARMMVVGGGTAVDSDVVDVLVAH